MINDSNKKRRKTLLTFTERNQEIIRLHSNGYSCTEIAEPLSISRQAVHEIIKKARDLALLPKPKHKKKKPKARKPNISIPRTDNTARNLDIIKFISSGMSCTEVGNHLGLSRSTICGVVYREKQKTLKSVPKKTLPKLQRPKNKPITQKPLPKYPDIMAFED